MSEAPSLCFIGGWGSTEAVWRETLDRLGENWLTQDRLTQDRLTRDREPLFLSWLDGVREWPAVLGRLRALPRRCVLVGWSLGGLLALRAALEWEWEWEWGGESPSEPRLESPPKPVGELAALVLVSATPRMCAAEEYGGADPRRLGAMRARMKRSPDAVLEEFASQCAAPDGTEETRLSWLQQAEQFSAEEMAAGLDCLATLDLRGRLEEVGVPCRILHGECDRIVPLGSAQFLAGRIAGAELEILAGRGHALPFTAAAEIARSIASVLR